jgi:tRNA1Val (adenine37-N6)-methyltransferase
MLPTRENMKSKGQFHFKQFSVSHEHSTHKVGTDGVLLGAWAQVADARHVLEVGTGTGVISLMLAQRTGPDARIDAVEIEKTDVDQAILNVKNSPWPEKIIVHHTPVQSFFPDQHYDLIVSNPPYFVNSYKPPEKKRTMARHTEELSFDELIGVGVRLLHPTGMLAVILPWQESQQFIALARQQGLHCKRQCLFRSRSHKTIERALMEFTFADIPTVNEELVLYAEGDNWSESYRELTRGFYLMA